MATVTYIRHDTCTNVTIVPEDDAEVINVILGFHPSSMNGSKIKDADEVAILYWDQSLLEFVLLVGSDFAAGSENIMIPTSLALLGPEPLTGDGVSKERLALGVKIYGALVTDSLEMHMTFHK